MKPNPHPKLASHRISALLLGAITWPFFTMTTLADEKQPAAFRTALIYDDIFLEHDTGPGFPESPDRLRMMTKHLKAHPVSKRLLWTGPSDKIDPMPWILEMHEEDYVKELKNACKAAEGVTRLGADNPISPRTYEVALKAVAGALTAVDAVMAGTAVML